MSTSQDPSPQLAPRWLRDVAIAAAGDGAALHLADPLPDDMLEAWKAIEDAGLDRAQLVGAIADRFQCERAELTNVAPVAARALPTSLSRKYGVVPIAVDKRTVTIATSDPGDLGAEQAIAFAAGRAVRFAIADPAEIDAVIHEHSEADRAAAVVAERLKVDRHGVAVLDDDLTSSSDDAPDADPTGVVRRIAATILGDAVAQGVSDVHLVRIGAVGVVRYRIDGIMREVLSMPANVYTRVISRIKVIGRLDISDRLRPQDGRARILVRGVALDLRLSTVPTSGGDERMVIRFLSDSLIQSLDSMDMAEPERTQLRTLLGNADGLVLLTGPTGSGKTTTLHAALKQRLTPEVTIMTVENPVEYKIEGVSQVQVEPKQGVTFALVLRAMLRQDPDIILVGECRDQETAETAAQAAMTGHLVLSTVHADDAPNALLRLRDMGLDTDTLGEAFRGAAAQRLLRRLCADCKQPVTPASATDDERRFSLLTGALPASSSVGCDKCRSTGYQGRMPIHQVFSISPQIRNLLRSGAEIAELRRVAHAEGMRTLGQSAATRIKDGVTTVAEAVRVLGARFWEELSSESAVSPAAGSHEEYEEPATKAEPSVDLATAAALGEVAGLLLEPAPGASADAPAAVPEPSVAVLPFINMSADPENDFFADGIAVDLIAALTNVQGLKVAARASSFAFRSMNADVGAIARTLGVRAVLQGSVRRAGDRVRVTTQLVNAADGYQSWSQQYDRKLDDIFAIQDEITQAIVKQVAPLLAPQHTGAVQPQAPDGSRPTTGNVAAYQLFLRGREATYQRTPASLRLAIDIFRQALAVDPAYARAHAGIAEAFIGLGFYDYVPARDARAEAERALAEASRLDPELAIVHNLTGQLKLYLRPDWRDAAAHFERALAVEPTNALSHAMLAIYHGMRGNLVACRDAAKRAVQLDPLSPYIRSVSCASFPREGIPGCDGDAALAQLEASLAIEPNSVVALWLSALRLADLGRFDEAQRRLTVAETLTQHAPIMMGLRIRILAQAGRMEEARQLRVALRARAAGEYVSSSVALQAGLLDVDDVEGTASLIRATIAEQTGPFAIYSTLAHGLRGLLGHPTLGPLIRQLSYWERSPAAD